VTGGPALLFENDFDCEFVALDQYPETAEVVARDLSHPRVRL
jgi:hypothetical protein